MNRIIKELKDVYDTFQKAEFVFDDPTAEGQLYLCHHKLKQVIKTLEAREQFNNNEDKKIKRIEERESGWWPNMADGNVSTLKQAINEIIDRLNGDSDE